MSVKTHPLSVTHLVVGLIFLSIAGSWALRQAGLIELDDLGWLFPLALVVAGGVGLLASMAKGVLGRKAPVPYEPERLEPAYDAPPPRPDYTSDIDRKLSEAERSQAREAGQSGRPSSTDTEPTTRIQPNDTEENER
jgi:hypothetical protein